MFTRFRVAIHFALFAGLLLSPLAHVALAVDAPSEVKGTTADAQPTQRNVWGTLLIHATEPVIWRSENKLDVAPFESYKRNVATIIRSRVVIEKALEDKGVQDLPLIKQHGDKAAAWLADQIKIDFPDNGQIMIVGMVADEEAQAHAIAVVVNAVINAFMKEFADRERMDKLTRYDNLDKKFLAAKQQLMDKQRQLYELVQAIGDKGGVALPKWKIAGLEQLAMEASRAEIQAELQIARTRHKLEGLPETSSDFKVVKADAELAEVDRKFWNDKSTALTKALGTLDEQRVPSDKFQGDAAQLRAQVEQLQALTRDMGNTLERWKIELDARPRIEVLEVAH